MIQGLAAMSEGFRRWHEHVLILFLLALTLLLRMHTIEAYDVGWDESTYILIGQDLLDGHLPYTNLWTIKPPLAFVPYALFILIFGKTIVAIRTGGIFLVWAAAIILYFAGKRAGNKWTGLAASVTSVLFSCLMIDAVPVLTEHLTLVPLSMVLLLAFQNKKTGWTHFLIGFCLSLAVLIRSNQVVLVTGLLLPPFLLSEPDPLFVRLKQIAAALAGFVAPIVAVTALYLAAGELDIFIKTNWYAALSYSGFSDKSGAGKLGLAQTLWDLLSQAMDNRDWLFWSAPVLSLGLLIYFLLKHQIEQKKIAFVLLMFILQLAGIVVTSRPYAHYLLQLIPFTAMLCGILLARLVQTRFWPAAILLAAILLHPEVDKAIAYLELDEQQKSVSAVVEYLNQQDVEGEYLFFFINHINYWLTNSKIPTRVAHPADIFIRQEMLKIIFGPDFTGEGEFRKILNKKPRFIVVYSQAWFVPPEYFKILDEELAGHYRFEKQFYHLSVYKRLP